jgi:hypothetical protein
MDRKGLGGGWWNHRVVANPGGDWDGGTIYELQEVHYDGEGNPQMYGECFMFSETLKGVKDLAKWLKKATKKPVLYPHDFPAFDHYDEQTGKAVWKYEMEEE